MMDVTEQEALLVHALFDEAAHDYVGLWQIVRRVSEIHPTAPAELLLDATLNIVKRLLDRGLIAGHLAGKGGFESWTEKNRDAVLRRIEAEWEALGRFPDINDICWFNRSDS